MYGLYGFFTHMQVPLFGGGVAAPFPGHRRSSALLQTSRLGHCQCLHHPLYRELGLTLPEEERLLALNPRPPRARLLWRAVCFILYLSQSSDF